MQVWLRRKHCTWCRLRHHQKCTCTYNILKFLLPHSADINRARQPGLSHIIASFPGSIPVSLQAVWMKCPATLRHLCHSTGLSINPLHACKFTRFEHTVTGNIRNNTWAAMTTSGVPQPLMGMLTARYLLACCVARKLWALP